MVYKVSITGIDGSGKSTSISKLVDLLSPQYLTAKIGRPTYISGPKDPQNREYLFTNLNKRIDGLHTFADNLENKLGVASVNIFNAFIWSLINRKVFSEYNPEIAIYGRDRIVDPAVYSTYYFPFTKKWSSEVRLNIARTISRAKSSDTLIYMDVNPQIAVERIEKRIEEEKKKSGIDRKKWRHMHENLQDLTNLKHYFTEALDYLYGHSEMDIHTIKVDDKNLQQVADEMKQIILDNKSRI
ncbi:MAG: hypothetical protein ACP5N1_03540 [Candidatus Woesearchaeota archaeon]